uniref:Uncharacterized protein n=1 Tax=Halimeda minima TaxID=170427 RepID=A0A386AYV9_9CHLO|nr:hypothetical protein [Halimeda minima]
MYDYGYVNFKLISGKLTDTYLRVTKKKLEQLQAGGLEPLKGKKALRLKAALPSLVPVLFSGSALAVLSYVLHPERLREIVALLADVIAILAQELGRVMLELIPPELHQLAQRIGAVIEFIGAYARLLVEQVIIPVLLYARTFGIWFVSVFFVFKLVTFGVQLWEILASSGDANVNVNVPPEVTAKALEVVDRVGAITAEDSPALFLTQFSKAVSLLVLGLVPLPLPAGKSRLVKLLHLSAIVSIYGLVLCDTRYIPKLASQALEASPQFCSMVSCVAGRWCLIIITGP